ncbi:MAG: flagellar transcriptional regulator FlhC [Oxalobacteraceae bacterium]|jgi:flagellar transcriptional activator FlhC|nr:flagellar transcriptional regulator FlhC [Oxalobacteraceae bacterium]
MTVRTVSGDAQQILLASELIRLGARLQLLESETTLSRERLLKLYKELRGVSPPKGMLPFSTDWFISWQPNIHASVFLGIYRYLLDHARLSGIDAVLKAYRLYLEQMPPEPSEQPVLSLTRAWTLIRFFDNRMLSVQRCDICHGQFISHAFQPRCGTRCGLCHPPARAGKRKRIDKTAEVDYSISSGSNW